MRPIRLLALPRALWGIYPGYLQKVSRPAGLIVAVVFCGASLAAAQDTGRDGAHARFSFGYPGLRLPSNPDLAPGARFGVRRPVEVIVGAWRGGIDRANETAVRQRWQIRLLRSFNPPVTIPAAVLPRPFNRPPSGGVSGAIGQIVDLNLELNARVETVVDQLRNLNCSVADVSNPAAGCQTPFPTPVLSEQFTIRAGGVIADRFHLNVDFDGQREFSAENTINIRYQGLEDEILQRVEVGNIDFRLPPFRFITSAIPANSFGMQADAQMGPVRIRGILAQQKGSSVRTRTFTVGDLASQNMEREGRDLEFEAGRFFYTIDPLGIPAYPDIDVLDLNPGFVSPMERPVDVRVYRLRPRAGSSFNPDLGGIDAVALRQDSPQRVGPFPWQLLIEGIDYYLDPTAMWFALRNRIGNDEFLAVSYVTALGDTVGTFPAINGAADTLELIHEPLRGPDVPTYFYEMRNVYRIGTDVSRNSIGLTLTLNESDRPLDGRGTYLTRFGVAMTSDPNRLDEYNRVFPRERDPNAGSPLRDNFLVFPHATPFANQNDLQPDERNDSLYRTPTYLLATEGPAPRFSFDWIYEVSGSADRSQLSLGALRVRDGSERLFVADRELVRGVDYTISYDLGVVTFSDPDALFAGPTQVRVQFEENQLFDIAPKNVLGFTGTYRFGARSRIDAIGLFQRERSIFTRPGLGSEPRAIFIGGISGDFEFRTDWVTRALDDLPFMSTDVPSRLEISGEVAMSRPNPNREGEAYVEEFEGTAARRITLLQHEFQLGSQPRSSRGVDPSLLSATGIFEPADAVPLVWQNAIEVDGGAFEVSVQQIDTSIVTTGTSRLVETLLWMTLKHDSVGGAPDALTGEPRWVRPADGGPRWRSITRPLDRSGLGVDLSRTEFFEFWLLEDFGLTARQQRAELIFDFGTVAEDAVAFGPDSFSINGADTTFTGFQRLGVGFLDSERDPVTNVFNAAIHDVGIHGDQIPRMTNSATGEIARNVPLCEQGFTVGRPVFPLGSLNARCTRRNGLIDSEDLNGDNRLDEEFGPAQENLIRHVVRIGEERFVVRTGVTLPDVGGRPMTWRLYRIPFRQDTSEIGSPSLRRVQSMRITIAAPDRGGMEEEFSVAFARMRLVGAPWVKRAATPLVGLGGATSVPRGEVVASVVSTDNQDLGYTSPPGVRNAADRLGAGLEPGQQEINERSLRLIARDLQIDERAEAFIRFGDESNRNFLEYRLLRLWARGRGAGWLEEDLEFFIKVGRDEHNFYMYRTTISAEDWLPEVVIELDRWLALRAEIARAWTTGLPAGGSVECAGGDPTAYIACDGQYFVQIRDPGIAPPNLARVSEVAVGIYRRAQSTFIPDAELWVDDIRLSDVVDDVGFARALDARFTAADFAEFSVAIDGRDDRFRQLNDSPDYRGDASTRISTTIRADKLMPEGWGLNMPVVLQRRFTDVDPFYVRGSDVETRALDDVRSPRSDGTSVQISVRRDRRGESAAARLLLDPMSIVASRNVAEQVTELSRSSVSERRVRLDYNNRPGSVTSAGAPRFVRSFIGALPQWIRESEFGRAIRTSRLRVNPQQVRITSALTDYHVDRNVFRVPVGLPGDSTVRPLESTIKVWRNDLGVELRPYSSLGLRIDYTSVRDLQDYGDSTTIGRLTAQRGKKLLGTNIGFERERRLETSVSIAPAVNSWLRPNFSMSTRFGLYRDPNGRSRVFVNPIAGGGFRVPEAIQNLNRQELGSTVDLARFMAAIGMSDALPGRLMRGILPADVRFRKTKGSSFNRTGISPDLRYQLGFGDIDDFRFRNGSVANTAYQTDEWTAAGGAQFPFGLLVRLNYRDIESTSWIRRGNSQTQLDQSTREWPSGALTWVYSPRWALQNFLSTITAQGRYRQTSGVTRQRRGGDGVLAEQDRRTMNPAVSVTWSNGMITSARWSRVRADVLSGGNLTRTDEVSWGGTMALSVRSPGWLANLPSDVRTTLGINGRNQLVCLRRTDAGSCAPVSDTRRQQIDLRLDTAFPPNMRGGANFSYVLTEQRHTSSRFSQLTLSVFVDINFLSSQVR